MNLARKQERMKIKDQNELKWKTCNILSAKMARKNRRKAR